MYPNRSVLMPLRVGVLQEADAEANLRMAEKEAQDVERAQAELLKAEENLKRLEGSSDIAGTRAAQDAVRLARETLVDEVAEAENAMIVAQNEADEAKAAVAAAAAAIRAAEDRLIIPETAAERFEREAAEAKEAAETAAKEAADVDHARAELKRALADVANFQAAGDFVAAAAAGEVVKVARENLRVELAESEEAAAIALREQNEAAKAERQAEEDSGSEGEREDGLRWLLLAGRPPVRPHTAPNPALGGRWRVARPQSARPATARSPPAHVSIRTFNRRFCVDGIVTPRLGSATARRAVSPRHTRVSYRQGTSMLQQAAADRCSISRARTARRAGQAAQIRPARMKRPQSARPAAAAAGSGRHQPAAAKAQAMAGLLDPTGGVDEDFAHGGHTAFELMEADGLAGSQAVKPLDVGDAVVAKIWARKFYNKASAARDASNKLAAAEARAAVRSLFEPGAIAGQSNVEQNSIDIPPTPPLGRKW